MAGWNLDLTIISATDLVDVRKFGRMKTYAQVSINEKPNLTVRTAADGAGKTSPRWNVMIPYILSEAIVHGEEKDVLVIKLICERSLGDDRYVGEVRLSLNSLFMTRRVHDPEYEEYQVSRADEHGTFGLLRISHRFRQHITQTAVVGGAPDPRRASGQNLAETLLSEGAVLALGIAANSIIPAMLVAL